MNIEMLSIDSWRIIFEKLKFLEKIRLTRTSKYLHENLKIYDITNKHYVAKLDNTILETYVYLENLRICYFGITAIGHLTNLKSLIAIGDCGITDKQIENLTNLTF